VRLLASILVIFLLPALSAGQAGPIPGTQPLNPVFQKADLVCSCRVRFATTQRASSLPKTSADTVRLTASVLRAYKSAEGLSRSIFVEYPGDPMSNDPGVTPGAVLLLFLVQTGPQTYTLADPFIGLTRFAKLNVGRPVVQGLDDLQTALATVAQQGFHTDRVNAMRLLAGFANFLPETISVANSLSTSQDPELAFSALALLVRADAGHGVPSLRLYIDHYRSERPPISFFAAASVLGTVSDRRALPDLEALSGSKYLWIQLASMASIRHIASPTSAHVLIQRLDDPNRLVKYSALITLAEIFGKGGDFGPSAELFDKDPRPYIRRWKDWLVNTGYK